MKTILIILYMILGGSVTGFTQAMIKRKEYKSYERKSPEALMWLLLLIIDLIILLILEGSN